MSQFFPAGANTIARLSILVAVILASLVMWAGAMIVRSPYETMQEVRGNSRFLLAMSITRAVLGLTAGTVITPWKYLLSQTFRRLRVCMNCHQEMWAVSPAVEPVRESYRSGRSIEWTRVHDLPEFVYFNHSIHVHSGVGCATCHGRVDEMPLTCRRPPRCSGASIATGTPELTCGRAKRYSIWLTRRRPTRRSWEKNWLKNIICSDLLVVRRVTGSPKRDRRSSKCRIDWTERV